jgi:hypothetical protein
MRRVFLISLVLFLIASCSDGSGDSDVKIAPSEEDGLPIISPIPKPPSPPPQPTVIADIFEDDFESESRTFSLWKTEAVRDNSIQIVDDHARSGDYAVKFALHPGDILYSGNRAELTYQDYSPNIGEVYYSWSVMLDSDYIDSGRWQILGQWHDQPDTIIGQTWENFEQHNPPISLQYSNNYMYAVIRPPLGKQERVGIFSKKKRVEREKWIDIVFYIYWSLEEDGFVEVWIDGENITPYNEKDYKIYAPTIFNRAGNYLKIGLYRADDATVTNKVYFDNIKIGVHAY